MLRRPADQYLTLLQIADDWSREIQPPRSKHELTNELGKAFWRGEFQASTGPTRLKVLQSCFSRRQSELLFWVQGECEPQTVWEQDDESAVVDLTPVLPVPSSTPDSWTDRECRAAYEVIAEYWGNPDFNIMEPFVTLGVFLSEPDFTKWASEAGHTRPDFWVRTPLDVVCAEPEPPKDVSQAPQRNVGMRKRGPKPKVLNRVKDAMRADIRSGKFTIEALTSFTEVSLESEYSASRDTARRARNEVLSEFVED